MIHKYKLAECDVPPERRSKLESYRGKLEVWSSWLNDDKDHAIWDVLASMTWRDASFRYLRQFAIDNDISALNNSLLTEALLSGYFSTQILAIRRLIDDRKDVISLRRLLKDIKAHFDLFTRENLVCHDGLPYDYDTVRRRVQLERAPSGKPEIIWGEREGPRAYAVAQMTHEHFDKLAGISPQQRSPEDRLPQTLIDTVEQWLDHSGADELAEWSHAYLAHAGNPISREQFADFKVTFDKIADTTRALARVAEAISADILYLGGRGHALIPVAQFTPFEHLDAPIMQADRTAEAWQLWYRLEREQNEYLKGVTEELLQGKETL